MRASTAATVVAIHSISSVGYLASTTSGSDLLNLFVHLLHYNREVFMFITGLVLTYIYYDSGRFATEKFWLNRLRLIFIPYVLWTVTYVIHNNPGTKAGRLIYLSAWNTLTGNASPQLYYVSLTLQFCAFFPLYLALLRKYATRPWKVLAISLGVQLLFITFDFYYLQAGPLSTNHAVTVFVEFQNRLLPMYRFFFLLGGYAALYKQQCQALLTRFSRLIPILMLIVVGLYSGFYYLQLRVLHEPLTMATSVLQPSVVLYSIAVIIFFSWAAMVWAQKRRLHSFVKNISDTSFGIYFIHLLILSAVINDLLPHVTTAVPLYVRIIGITVVTFVLSAAACYGIFRVPFLSWTIGRPRKISLLRFKKVKSVAP